VLPLSEQALLVVAGSTLRVTVSPEEAVGVSSVEPFTAPVAGALKLIVWEALPGAGNGAWVMAVVVGEEVVVVVVGTVVVVVVGGAGAASTTWNRAVNEEDPLRATRAKRIM
jgi:hypothetical protein